MSNIDINWSVYISIPSDIHLKFRNRSQKTKEEDKYNTLIDLSQTFAQNTVIPMSKKKKKGSNRAGKSKYLKA